MTDQDSSPGLSSLRQIARAEDPESAAQQVEHAQGVRRRRRRFRLGAGLLLALLAAEGVWFATDYLDRGSIVGQVQDFQGQPIAGALVQVEGSTHCTETDSGGGFLLTGIHSGANWVVIQVPQASGTAVPIFVPSGQTVDVGAVRLYHP